MKPKSAEEIAKEMVSKFNYGLSEIADTHKYLEAKEAFAEFIAKAITQARREQIEIDAGIASNLDVTCADVNCNKRSDVIQAIRDQEI